MGENSTLVCESEEMGTACFDGSNLFWDGRTGEAEGRLGGDVQGSVVDCLFGSRGSVEEVEGVEDRDEERGFGSVWESRVGSEIGRSQEGGDGGKTVDDSIR